ncbi:MAG TPA: hypothetical protein VG841_14250 [Caulobacterales bacterium]|nr:hypothetical protein [Caulobacterales bacterium]
MSEQTAAPGYNPSSEDDRTLEASARSLSEFVIRAALLPVSLLLTKPSRLAEAAATGNFRPLPSPFLLALTAGVIVSGVTSNLDKFSFNAATERGVAAGAMASDFLKAVIDFYGQMDGVKAILFAIPYVFFLWIFAGFISFSMLKGIKHAEPLFASVSLCLSALVELAVLAIVIVVTFDVPSGEGVAIGLLVGFLIYTLILAFKLVRLVFVLKRGEKWRWLGASLASLPSLFVVLIVGMIAAGLSITMLSERQLIRKMEVGASVEVVATGVKPKPDAAAPAAR